MLRFFSWSSLTLRAHPSQPLNRSLSYQLRQYKAALDHQLFPASSQRWSRVESLRPGACSAWLQVAPPTSDAPWQSRAQLCLEVSIDDGKVTRVPVDLVVSGISAGHHQVALEHDPDTGLDGRINIWKGDEPVRGPLSTVDGTLEPPCVWAGIEGRRNRKRQWQRMRAFWPRLDKKRFEPLQAVIERDLQSTDYIVPRVLPAASEPPSIDDWDQESLALFLGRLPVQLRQEIKRFSSPITQAGLCLGAAQILHLAPYVDRHALNVVTTLKPGETSVRVYHPIDVTDKKRTLPLKAVRPDGTVMSCYFQKTSCPALAEKPVDLEYGILPLRKSRRGSRYSFGRNPFYGVSLSYRRKILLRSAGAETGLPTWHAVSRGTALQGPQWPGILQIIEADSRRPNRRGVVALRPTLPPGQVDMALPTSETDADEWSNQFFEPYGPKHFSIAFPEELPDVLVLDAEVDTIQSLLDSRIPRSGVSQAVQRRLESLGPDRLPKALVFLLDHFKSRRLRESTRRRHSLDEVGVPRSRCFPQTLNFVESVADLERVDVFVKLSHLEAEFLVPKEDGTCYDLLIWQGPLAPAPHTPTFGFHGNLRMKLVESGSPPEDNRPYHLVFESAVDGQPFGTTVVGRRTVGIFGRFVDCLGALATHARTVH